jgi:hypothetical protein
MQVLFLALGASRQRAVVEESAAVVAVGNRAVVLVSKKKSWDGHAFASGVELVTAEELTARHFSRRLERLVLYRVPYLVVCVVGRGLLGSRAQRAYKAYERKIAGRFHRRVFMPLHRKLWPKLTDQMVRRHFTKATSSRDLLVVVTDPLSVPRALRLTRYWASKGLTPPRVSYSIDSYSSLQS